MISFRASPSAWPANRPPHRPDSGLDLQCDCDEKPQKYLQIGIREFWIVDTEKQRLTILRRSRGRWAERVLRPGQLHKTELLPGFEFDCAAVFAATGSV